MKPADLVFTYNGHKLRHDAARWFVRDSAPGHVVTGSGDVWVGAHYSTQIATMHNEWLERQTPFLRAAKLCDQIEANEKQLNELVRVHSENQRRRLAEERRELTLQSDLEKKIEAARAELGAL